MRKIAYIFTIIICGMGIESCHDERIQTESHIQDSIKNSSATHSTDTLLVITMPEDALWGRLGEGTGMSVLQFITDNGDTLYINKESEITGRAGTIYGGIRNYTDRFCITTTDGGTALLKAVNVTELQETWTDKTHIEK